MRELVLAERLAAMALGCVQREFPYNPGHPVRGARDLHRPRDLHPAFYGCYDWHSAVHGHWLLAHLLRRYPGLRQAKSIGLVLEKNLSAKNLRTEARYLEAHPGFERPYGWAWLLQLAGEVRDARFDPLVRVIEQRYLEWLPKQTYPIRSGTHANTAFGLSFALDHARRTGRKSLEKLIVRKSMEYYGGDRDYPAVWEPGGNDFLSPCLVEADLMRRVAPDFPKWFAAFLPRIPPSLLSPAKVTDRGDGQLAHLDGLNLSRAWCFYALAKTNVKKAVFLKAGDKHLKAGLRGLRSGAYEGEHWLATFAAYALACALDGATTTPAPRSLATWVE